MLRFMAERKDVWDYRTEAEVTEIGGDRLFRLLRALDVAEQLQMHYCHITPQRARALLACRPGCCDDRMEHGSIPGQRSTDAVTMREVAAGLGVSQPVASRIITKLEQDGLVHRSMHPRDKRRTCVTLSREGLKAVRRVEDGYRRIWGKVLARIPDGDLPAFMKTLGDLVDVAEDVRVDIARG